MLGIIKLRPAESSAIFRTSKALQPIQLQGFVRRTQTLRKFGSRNFQVEVHGLRSKRPAQWRTPSHIQHRRVSGNQPKPNSAPTVSLFRFDQHLEGSELEIGHSSYVKCHNHRSGFVHKMRELVLNLLRVGKEDSAFDPNHQ